VSDDVKNSEDMGSLLDAAGNMDSIHEGEIVEGTVVQVNRSEAFVDIGYKQEIPIPKRELAFPEPESAEDVVKVGDKIEVYIQSLGGENGGALSKVKADRMSGWKELENVKANGGTVQAKVSQVVKGGLVAFVNEIRAFIPASQMELHFVRDLSVYIDQTIEAVPIEIDKGKQRLVLSRRPLLEKERTGKQQEIFDKLEAGQICKGVVKRLTDYGAFIDVGGVDGLAHISDLSWKRINKPDEILKVGQEIDVYIKNVDSESKRISLSVKDTQKDPWSANAEKYTEGQEISGKIVKLAKFGAFMEIEPGFDGLIPMGELSDRRVESADEAVQLNQEVKVKIMRIDSDRKRISLSIKRAKENATEK
jgi:small subunit ribosomal protein S1/4-hydroxy-3-methylbut-2-enyl diphosphate reductase